MRIISFKLSEEFYGIPFGTIQEIVPIGPITPLPYGPLGFKGLMNLRGNIIGAMDIGPILGLDDLPLKGDEYVIIINADGIRAGIIAQNILELHRISKDMLRQAPEGMKGKEKGYFSYMFEQDGKIIIILDIIRIIQESIKEKERKLVEEDKGLSG